MSLPERSAWHAAEWWQRGARPAFSPAVAAAASLPPRGPRAAACPGPVSSASRTACSPWSATTGRRCSRGLSARALLSWRRCFPLLRAGPSLCVWSKSGTPWRMTVSAALPIPGRLSGQCGTRRLFLPRARGWRLEAAPTPLPSRRRPCHALRLLVCFPRGRALPAGGAPRLFEGPPEMRDRMAMRRRTARRWRDRVDGCRAAL